MGFHETDWPLSLVQFKHGWLRDTVGVIDAARTRYVYATADPALAFAVKVPEAR